MPQHTQQLQNAQTTLQQIQQQLEQRKQTIQIQGTMTNQLQTAAQELQQALNDAGLGQQYAIQQTLSNVQHAQQQLTQAQHLQALNSIQQAQQQLKQAQQQL